MYSAEDLFTEDPDADLDRIIEGNEDDVDGENGDEDNQELNDNDNDDENNTANKDEDKDKTKTKRVVRNPQPKLNAETLRKPRGLLCLESLFDRVKFRGRGHEEQDLNVLLKTYEYWCHRLFPKLPFDACVAKLEQLGNKKPVQSYLKVIRMDMVTDADENPDTIGNDLDIEQEEHMNNEENENSLNNVDPFDNLLPQREETTHSAEPVEWTEEQLKRLEENRKRAQKIKLEKLRKIQQKATLVLEKNTNTLDIDLDTQNNEFFNDSQSDSNITTHCTSNLNLSLPQSSITSDNLQDFDNTELSVQHDFQNSQEILNSQTAISEDHTVIELQEETEGHNHNPSQDILRVHKEIAQKCDNTDSSQMEVDM